MAVNLDIAAIKSVYDALHTHAKRTGQFEQSTDHEPQSPAGRKITFMMTEGPLRTGPSGLAATSLTWTWAMRVMSPARTTATADTDQRLTAAAVAYLAGLASDIDLTGAGVKTGLIRRVNVLAPVTEPKWVDVDGSDYRARDITIDIEINDAFSQAVA